MAMARSDLNEFQKAAAVTLFGERCPKASTTRKLATELGKLPDAGIAPALVVLLAGKEIDDAPTRLMDAEREVESCGKAGSRPEFAAELVKLVNGATGPARHAILTRTHRQVRDALAACGAIMMARAEEDEEPVATFSPGL